jgi:hypothetical protein
MYTFQLPPQRIHPHQAKVDHYKEQTDEMLETTSKLLLAYDLVKDYSQADANYYRDMYNWLNSRYDYVLGYALTFIPYSYESR